jgi:hypothetical protein
MSVGNNSNGYSMVAIGPASKFWLTDQNKKKINNQEYAGKSICIRISYLSVNLSNNEQKYDYDTKEFDVGFTLQIASIHKNPENIH